MYKTAKSACDQFAQITGNLVLIVFYGSLLGIAAKVISGEYIQCIW